MTIAIIYFSPTGSTARIAKEVSKSLKELEIDVEELDITSYSDRQKKIDFKSYDFIFFGFPIYVHRVPSVIREWFLTLDGNGKKCSTFFTYGGITTGIVHFDTIKRLKEQKFQPISSAEFVAKHTFNIGGWTLLEDRPNEKDLLVAKEYAARTYEMFQKSLDSNLEFEDPQTTEKQLKRLDRATRGVQLPSRNGQECSMCLDCEMRCPSNAMNAQIGEADGNRCIKCLRCVDSCPDGAIKVNDLKPAYVLSVEEGPQPLSEIESKESKYYV